VTSTVAPVASQAGLSHPAQPSPDELLDVREFRTTMGELATGVCVAAATRGRRGRAMTVNSFTSVSLDPMLVLVCIAEDSELCGLLTEPGAFAVSVLGAQQAETAVRFTVRGRPSGQRQFAGPDWRQGAVTGAPVLDGAVAWVECEVAQVVPAGDHAIVLGRVRGLGRDAPGAPLTFHRGRYGTVTEATTASQR